LRQKLNSLFSSTLDTVASLRLKKIKDNTIVQCRGTTSTLRPLRDQPEKWSIAGRKLN